MCRPPIELEILTQVEYEILDAGHLATDDTYYSHPAALSLPAIPVWIGATLALGTTSALGIVVGRKLLRRIPLHRLHQISGVFFLILAAFALTKVF